ncbi:ATP-dependent RNA helicase [Paramagnetospirillum magnetotacticum MS-1]|uniref:DEAD-box ATP-dependent RNA helicase RhpA n=1 Tax=Paramagnetospirillum magnetotacticum MS-1 TaxID=272627 RepID=A0A0C2YZ09_PARME|nr:DEAD/DEAH box helicase [Paramagnetospirillum magnetotacticum]KIL99905.1 ATP-dependent RNA helicase [Paramagnetospirillum magnetotacticum MS-1]
MTTHQDIGREDGPETTETTFEDLGLGPEILKALAESGYTHPTPIQAQAIPVVLMGRDVLGCAQTGTGKTASFTLPMIEILAAGRAKARMPRSLILAPTRELAAQVAENFDKYGKYHPLKKALIIGGESMSDQVALLDRGVDVLIATPGRLLDMFERGRILLNDVKVLVIDEADRMLDMGFIPDVEKIVGLLPKIRQTLFFSATMGPEIRRLADAFLMNPKEVKVSTGASAATTVVQAMAVVEEIDKRETLRHLIRVEEVKNAFIFCNRKRDVDVLFRSLKKHGFDVVQLHGDMAQSARGETLEKFKKGEARLMVCSDVAARGIDISAVSHVFNFDVPIHAEDYVHRIGRTGRAGMEGHAFTIASPDDGRFVGAIEAMIGTTIPRIEVEGVPALELDMTARKGRGGRSSGGAKDGKRPARAKEEGRDEARPRRERRPRRDETPAPSEVEALPVEAVAVEAIEQPREERPERAERPRGRGRDRDRDEPRRDAAPREDRRPSRGRDDRGGRRRGRIDELGIGEMLHPDGVIGFGDHMPDFIAAAVPLPVKSAKSAEDSDSDADLDSDSEE